jgi:uncharacterized membrane protein
MARTADRMATAGTRLGVGAVAGVAVGGACLLLTAWEVAILLAWDVTAAVFLVWVWSTIWRLPDTDVAAVATREDQNRAATDVVLVAAAVACLVAVGFVLLRASDAQGGEKAALVTLAVLSVLESWGVVHTIFVLRYARLYYEGPDGGIDFHDDAPPGFSDFAYLAFTVGMTYQVSDTEITSRVIRATILRHALLSFVFGTFIVAMTINVIAGLLL